MSLPAEAELIQAALAASEHAYIPYSNYRVGAALLTTDGEVYHRLQRGKRQLHADHLRRTDCAGQSDQRR